MSSEKEMGIHITYSPTLHALTLHLDCEEEGVTSICMPIDEFARLVDSMQEALALVMEHHRAGLN